MFKKIIVPSIFLLTLVLALLINNTNPTQAGPGGILSVFVLIYLIAIGVSIILIRFYYELITSISRYLPKLRNKKPFALNAAYYYSTILGLIPVFVVGFRSVGSMGLYEFVLIVIFEILGIFYIRKKVLS